MPDVTNNEMNSPDPDRGHDEKLVLDLQRLIEYATAAKSVDIAPQLLDTATNALHEAKTSLSGSKMLSQMSAINLYKAIDLLVPKIFPATQASLEIAEVMEAGSSGGTDRQREIRNRVRHVISTWRWLTILP